MNILIADKLDEHGLIALRKIGFSVVYDPNLDGEGLLAAIKASDCEVLVVRSTRVTGAMFEAGAALRLIIRAGSGFDTIDVAAADRAGVSVCNCPGMNAVAVAELTIGLMIALDRRIVEETDDLREGVWNKKKYGRARGLKGRVLGIVGLGRVGQEVARRAAAFEMHLMYADTVERPDVEREVRVQPVPLETLLRESDFVSLHVPGGPGTFHMIGADELALMKPTSFVINCSRGGIVDEVALKTAVTDGTIAGAALDVYEIEPAASDRNFKDPIGMVPQVYGTHHVGASTAQAQEAVADEVVKIIRTFCETGKALNRVNSPGVPTGT